MTAATEDRSRRIRVLNDNFRTTFAGGTILMTASVAELPIDLRARLLLAVKSFDDFSKDNDPWGEHDFGEIAIEGETYFWKIEYYAPDLNGGIENAALPETARVLTVMRADEY